MDNDHSTDSYSDEHGDADRDVDSVNECEQALTSPTEMPQEMDHIQDGRDPETGRFIKGWKGGGRPKGAKDKLNQQVIGTLERIWQIRGDEIIEHLAAEKPEVLAGLVAKLIPQSLAAEAIEGEKRDGNQGDTQVTIKVVTDQSRDVLPPREVEGELLPDTTH